MENVPKNCISPCLPRQGTGQFLWHGSNGSVFTILVSTEKEIDMNNQTNDIIVQNQLTLMNECFHCQQLNELCADCLDAKEARDAVIAHQLVDESTDYIIRGYGSKEYRVANGGTITESSPMSDMHDQTSGHDWISNEVIVREEKPTLSNWDRTQGESIYTMRTEFFEQSSWLIDRLFDLDESMEVTKHECICSVCHYTINKHAVCPNCN
jgi:hypothetical protein